MCTHEVKFDEGRASYDGFALVAHAIFLVTFRNGNTCHLAYHIKSIYLSKHFLRDNHFLLRPVKDACMEFLTISLRPGILLH